jgi:hypothetical protein
MTVLNGKWKSDPLGRPGRLDIPVHAPYEPGMRAITFCGLLFSLIVFTASTQAQNLLQNGSFQTGDFTDWTLTGNAQVENSVPVSFGSYAAVLNSGSSTPNAVLTQSFNTAVGQAYQLTFDYGATAKSDSQSIIATLTDANGDYLVSSQYYGTPGVASNYHPFTVIFVPTTAITTLGFRDVSALTTAQDGLLDHVQVIAIPPFSHPGEYVGTDTETLSYYGHPIVDSRTLNVKMEIDTAGRMLVLLGPIYDTTVGTISNGGQVTLGATGAFLGTAALTGDSIVFTVTEYDGVGGNFSYSTLVKTRKYVIHRVGPAQ